MAVARQADLLASTAQANILDHIQLLHRLLAGYLVYLDRQLTEEEASRSARAAAAAN
jgi:hypothetical protein